MRHIMALACAALASGAPAYAENLVSSEADLSVAILLTDLNVGDGIAPSIALLEKTNALTPGSSIQMQASNDYRHVGEWTTYANSSPAPFASLAGSVDPGLARVSGSITGGGPFVATVSGSASGLGGAYSGYVTPANLTSEYQFMLSPYTAVTFQGVASVVAELTPGQGLYNYATASADLYASMGSQGSGKSMYVTVRSGADVSPNRPTHDAFLDVPITVTLSNETGEAQGGLISADVAVIGTVRAVPVPEPSEWASMLAGLSLLLGWQIKRSRSGAARQRVAMGFLPRRFGAGAITQQREIPCVVR